MQRLQPLSQIHGRDENWGRKTLGGRFIKQKFLGDQKRILEHLEGPKTYLTLKIITLRCKSRSHIPNIYLVHY